MFMRCEEVARRSSAYQDQELGRWESTLVRLHLWTCAKCRRGFAQLGRVIEGLKEFAGDGTPLQAPLREDLLTQFRDATLGPGGRPDD